MSLLFKIGQNLYTQKYVKLVEALCFEHQVNLLTVDDKKLGN